MKNIRFFEEAAANGHVALNVLQYDGWLLRFSEGYTNRANSVSVLYPSTLDLSEKIAYCEDRYAARGLPCVFKLTDDDRELAEMLEKRGYAVVTPTDVMLCDLNRLPPSEPADCVFPEMPEWLPDYLVFDELTDPLRQDVFRRMLSRVMVDTIYCTLMHEGKPAACASAAMEQGYMLLQNVVVDPAQRGKGLGKKLCLAILGKAKEAGAHHAYLQVVRTNRIAMGLYGKLGFEKIYTYRYLKK